MRSPTSLFHCAYLTRQIVQYLVTGVLQGALLTMCLLWRSRQRRLGIDDWGRKLDSHGEEVDEVPGERTRLIE